MVVVHIFIRKCLLMDNLASVVVLKVVLGDSLSIWLVFDVMLVDQV